MNTLNPLNIQEKYSKWGLNEQTGARYRTISIHIAKNNFNHIFAVEVLSDCRRKLITQDLPEFSGVLAECTRIDVADQREKRLSCGVTCDGCVRANHELL